MNIEQKAKAYDEALERAKEWITEREQLICPREIVESIFPQLRESEDERIRKAIESIIRVYGKTQGEWIAGYDMDTLVVHLREAFGALEKQKEQKPDSGKEKLIRHCIGLSLTDVNEQRFKDYGLTLKDCLSWLEKQKERNDEDEECTDFTIYHPLKNGEGKYECIPYSFYGSLTSFSEDKDLIDFLRTCFYTKEECNEWIEQQKEQKPEEKPVNWTELTWEDINELEDIINKVHYEFRNGIGQESFGKEVLEQFREYKGDEYLDEEQKPTDLLDTMLSKDPHLPKQAFKYEQKPAKSTPLATLLSNYLKNDFEYFATKKWDEKKWNEVMNIQASELLRTAKNELEKEKKSAEWSEEDEEMLEYIIGDVNDAKQLYTSQEAKDMADKEIAWLKSLRPSWKPSKDEERLINTAISFLKDFADKGYENAVECIDWLKSKLNGNSGK